MSKALTGSGSKDSLSYPDPLCREGVGVLADVSSQSSMWGPGFFSKSPNPPRKGDPPLRGTIGGGAGRNLDQPPPPLSG